MAWETKTKIFNLPLLSVGGSAKGIIAIGMFGKGIITIAQFGYGVICIAQLGFGFISITQIGAGFFVVGQITFGLIFALGQIAIGLIAVGGAGIGYYGWLWENSVDDQIIRSYYQVIEDPLPLIIWSVFLILSVIYVYGKRGNIAENMSILDLFRPQIKHSIELIRSKAISRLKNEGKLLDIATADPSMTVRADALMKIRNKNLLRAFIIGDHPGELKIIALRRINDDKILLDILKNEKSGSFRPELINLMGNEKILAEAAMLTLPVKLRTAAIKKITDMNLLLGIALAETGRDIINSLIAMLNGDKFLARLAVEGVSPYARLRALKKMGGGDKSFFEEIALKDGDSDVSIEAMGRIAESGVFGLIAESERALEVRIAAVKKVDDKKILIRIAGNKKEKPLTDAARARLEEIRPFYNFFKIEISCPYCSQPVFINGPLRKIKCGFCLREVKIKDGVWTAVLKSEFGVTRYTAQNDLLVEKGIGGVTCSGCGGGVDADDVPDDSEARRICLLCGVKNYSFPLPAWFTWAENANHVFSAEHETEDTMLNEKMEPIAFSCVKCGGPLEITNDTPRTTRCRYCNTVQFLPDALWLSFHPVKIKKSWVIRFSFREREKIKKRHPNAR